MEVSPENVTVASTISESPWAPITCSVMLVVNQLTRSVDHSTVPMTPGELIALKLLEPISNSIF